MTTIRVIFAGFAGTMILSVVMIFVTMPHGAAAKKTVPPPCACKCMRKAGAQ